ncbi:hypothetical protein ACDX78_13460 [Virgibacillus oceani]
MSKFIALKQALHNRLDSANEYPLYDTQAPEQIMSDGRMIKTPYPYSVYKLLPIDSTVPNRTDYTLEVSHWDKPEGTSQVRVSEMADSTFEALKHFRFLDDKNLIIAGFPNIGHVPDNDPQVQRIDVTSTLQTYRR